jgi:hypothetical protein
LLPLGAVVDYYYWTHTGTLRSYEGYRAGGLGIGAIYLGIRCLWYAISGRNNINRDDF